MPIKRSSLERKWYFRLGKVVLLLLPLAIILWMLLQKKMISCEPASDLRPETIAFMVVAAILYYVFLALFSRGILYVVFGGVEEDGGKRDFEEKTGGEIVSGGASGGRKKSYRPDPLLPMIFLFAIIAFLFLVQSGYIKFPKMSWGNFNFGGGSAVCRQTSAEWGLPCHSRQPEGPTVSALPVPAKCDCPSDTVFVQMDNITAGGPYKICACR
ncbi:MAG: hypothetical protein M1586_01010 [Patescibacteria group bacterium]|nr:hypothetical protein [Patescibacteria group bacterium]MCL5261866.1 hypothetical protein [Patescibacteria group bacterium]